MAATDDISAFKERVLGREITSEDTADLYAMWVGRFKTWNPGREPGEAALRDFDSFLQDPDRADYPWETGRGRPAPDEYAYQTRIIAISALKLWFKVQHDLEITTEPDSICVGEPDPFDPTVLSKRDIKNVIDNASGDCDNPTCEAALQLGYDCIMRAAEVCKVRQEDISWKNRTILVRAVKGSNRTRIGMDSVTIGKLDQLFDRWPDRDPIFRNSYGDPWKPKPFALHFRRKHHEAGFHSFARHSPIVHRLESGDHDFGDVYRRARHARPSMTAKYGRLVDAEIPDYAEREG